MFDFNEKDQAVYDWLRATLGENFPIIQAQQDAPRPVDDSDKSFTYVAFQANGIMRVGTGDEMRFDQIANAFAVHGQRKVPYLLEAVGANAYSVISEIQNSLGLPSVRDLLRARGLGVLNEGDVVDVTQFLETEFEARTQLTVTFHYQTITNEDPGRIEKVNIDANLNGKAYNLKIE